LQVSVDGEHLRETREAVLGKVGLTHPILYDICDLACLQERRSDFQGQDA